METREQRRDKFLNMGIEEKLHWLNGKGFLCRIANPTIGWFEASVEVGGINEYIVQCGGNLAEVLTRVCVASTYATPPKPQKRIAEKRAQNNAQTLLDGLG